MDRHTTTIDIQSSLGVTVRNLFIYHEPISPQLMILLPGRGYTCNHPVLHYTRRLGLDRGFDVLSMAYGFQVANVELEARDMGGLEDEVTQATQQVLKRDYERVCIVGKSLGTPLAAQLARELQPTMDSISLILLTPVGGALHGLGDLRTLAIIGTGDPLYAPEMVEATKDGDQFVWQVFDGLNHGLEMPDDWQASIQALNDIIAACDAFLAPGNAEETG
jgi:hypothetical protein